MMYYSAGDSATSDEGENVAPEEVSSLVRVVGELERLTLAGVLWWRPLGMLREHAGADLAELFVAVLPEGVPEVRLRVSSARRSLSVGGESVECSVGFVDAVRVSASGWLERDRERVRLEVLAGLAEVVDPSPVDESARLNPGGCR
ncbi:MAG: hypothetical protein WAX12_13410 [Candidatus Microthrix subdominans]